MAVVEVEAGDLVVEAVAEVVSVEEAGEAAVGGLAGGEHLIALQSIFDGSLRERHRESSEF